ncbi:MAG: hypothetical protein Q9227_003624 [Pyrenula ochraceoflavens]
MAIKRRREDDNEGECTHLRHQKRVRVGSRRQRRYKTTKQLKFPLFRSLGKEDPFIPLQSEDSGVACAFLGTESCRASLVTDSFTFVPRSFEKTPEGLELFCKISGGKVAPRLTIQAKIGTSIMQSNIEVKLELYPGVDGQIFDIEIIDNPPFFPPSTPSSDSATVIKINARSASNSGLDLQMADIDEELSALLDRMQHIAHGGFEFEDIYLVIDASAEFIDALQAFIHCTNKPNPLWWPYLDQFLRPKCTLEDMARRVQVHNDCGGLFRIPAKNTFATQHEALIILANGVYLEYRNAPALHLRDRWPGSFGTERYLRRQLFACEAIFSQSALTMSRDWVGTFLNQQAQSLRRVNPTEDCGLPKAEIQTRFQAIKGFFEWNEEQLTALEMGLKLSGNVGIVEGAAGTGKTTVLAGLACFYAMCGASVLICAPCASAAAALADKLSLMLQRNGGSKYGLSPQSIVRAVHAEAVIENINESKKIVEAQFLVTTPNFVVSDHLCKDFGRNYPMTMVLHDDAHLIMETELLSTVFCLHDLKKIGGLVCTVDLKEWPLAISTRRTTTRQILAQNPTASAARMKTHFSQFREFLFTKAPHYPTNLDGLTVEGVEFYHGINEFADQAALSLPFRLLREGFPSVMLRKQVRATRSLSSFPNAWSYPRVIADLSFTTRPDQATPHGSLVYDWLGQPESSASPVAFINASNGADCMYNHDTRGKHNPRNAEVVLDLLSILLLDQGMSSNDIALLVPYRDQVYYYNNVLGPRKARDLGVSENLFSLARTVDSMRGKEARFVIYDLVLTGGQDRIGLGIVQENYRAHVASTRASECLIIVGSSDLWEVFPSLWKLIKEFEKLTRAKANETKVQRGQGKAISSNEQADDSLPYIVDYANYLMQQDLVFTPPTPRSPDYPEYDPPSSMYKHEELEFADWEE